MGKGGLLAAVMAKRFLALFVLIFSVVKSNANQKNEETRSSLERAGSNCQDSAPFFIKNRSRKAKKPYLTVDLSTNAVNGGRKTGEANQQWMWRDCGKDGDGNLVNVATGLCLTDRVNDNNRHIQAASISTGIKIPSSSGLSWYSDTGKANSWELQMDITVTHSTNGTYFMTVGWGPGGYSGIQQTPSTRYVPSGKNFLFSMWDTNTDNHGNAEGGTPSYSYVDKLNEEADVGGKIGVINRKFGGEGTGQQIQIDYPWAIGDTTTAFIRGFRTSVGGEEWCVSSGLRAPGREEVFLARFCRKSPEDVLKGWGFYVFIEDWIAWPSCPATGFEVGFMKQRAAIFSNWKVTVDMKEVETAAPDFRTNLHGYARGLTDAGMLGDNAFYVSTGGWKYDNPYNP